MVTLYNAQTGAMLGTIDDAALLFLQDHLEEESLDDHDYWFNPATVEMLAADGADSHLIQLLQGAVGNNEEGIEIAFAREGEPHPPTRPD